MSRRFRDVLSAIIGDLGGSEQLSEAQRQLARRVALMSIQCEAMEEKSIARPDNTSDFEALRSRHGQAEAILVAYDIMEVDGHDVRPEPLEERRNRLAKLLSRKTKAMRDGIQFSEAITGDGPRSFAMRAGWNSKASSQSASARAMSAGARARG